MVRNRGGQLMPKPEIFVITPDLQRVLDSVPEQNDPRSKLDPFRPYILKWRRQGKTYRKIQQILRVECRMPVAYETLRQFVKSRSRPRKPVGPEIEIEPAAVQPNSHAAATSGKRLTAEERQAQLEFIRSLSSKPALSDQPEKVGWNLGVDKPRVVNKT
jgi:hypothetical protein